MKSLPDIATDAEGTLGNFVFYGYVVVRARFFGVFDLPILNLTGYRSK
jgi:hypothetical protein